MALASCLVAVSLVPAWWPWVCSRIDHPYSCSFSRWKFRVPTTANPSSPHHIPPRAFPLFLFTKTTKNECQIQSDWLCVIFFFFLRASSPSGIGKSNSLKTTKAQIQFQQLATNISNKWIPPLGFPLVFISLGFFSFASFAWSFSDSVDAGLCPLLLTFVLTPSSSPPLTSSSPFAFLCPLLLTFDFTNVGPSSGPVPSEDDLSFFFSSEDDLSFFFSSEEEDWLSLLPSLLSLLEISLLSFFLDPATESSSSRLSFLSLCSSWVSRLEEPPSSLALDDFCNFKK